MAPIRSRKHTTPRFTNPIGTAFALLLLPAAAHGADAPTQTLPEITVQGAQGNDFKAERAASPKYTETLLNTPQTITVIKKELIEQQGAVTLTEALRNTPGVGTFFLGENGSTSTGDAIYMRGFDASGSIYVDGVRDVGALARDVFNIEQIDVLKGPAGTDSGRGSPTGSINLTSKQANLENAFYSSVTAGSGRQKRVAADWNKVIDSESGSAFRINLLDQDSGNPARDQVTNKRWGIAPTISFGLKGPTRATLSYLHVKQDNVPDGGVPTIGLPGYTSPDPKRPFIGAAPMVDPKNYYGAASDFERVTADMVTAHIEHDFSPAFKLQNTSRYGKTQQNYLLTSFMGNAANLLTPTPADVSTWTLLRPNLRTVRDQRNEILANQTTVSVDFATGAVKHSVVGGLELLNEKVSAYGYSGFGTLQPVNLYHPDANAPVSALNLVRNGARSDASTSTESAYVFDTLKVGEKWQFNGGVRVDHFNASYTSIALAAAGGAVPAGTLVPTSLDLSNTLLNGKISALYKPTADSSVYALIATSKQPPGSAFVLSTSANSASNPVYDPQSTTTKEIGSKWDFLKQKLSLTAALYRTDIRNEVEQDPSDLLWYQSGKKRVQGIELGATGEILRGWLVSAGYTRMNTSVESGKVVSASGINNLNYTPKQAFTGWTSYTLPFGLKLGGGARFVDAMLRGSDGAIGTPAQTKAYWVVDAMASYPVSKNIDLQLNVYNLADTAYVAAINKSGYRYTPGAPRSASVSANFKF